MPLLVDAGDPADQGDEVVDRVGEPVVAREGGHRLACELAAVGGGDHVQGLPDPLGLVLDQRDRLDRLGVGTGGPQAQEPALPHEAALSVVVPDRDVIEVARPVHRRVPGVLGHHHHLGSLGDLPCVEHVGAGIAQQAQAGALDRGEGVAVDGVLAVAEQLEVVVGHPAQQVADPAHPRGHHGLWRLLEVVDRVQEAVVHQPVVVVGEPGRRQALLHAGHGGGSQVLGSGAQGRVGLDRHPRLRLAATRRAVRGDAGEDAVTVALDHQDRVPHGPDGPPKLGQGRRHGVDDEGPVVGDDLQQRRAARAPPVGLLARGGERHQVLAPVPRAAQVEVSGRLAPGAADRHAAVVADHVLPQVGAHERLGVGGGGDLREVSGDLREVFRRPDDG